MKLLRRLMNVVSKEDYISDGYHTFKELYDYRMVYNALAFNQLVGTCEVFKSKRHNDGELCFSGGWFIVVAELPGGQVSNHYEMKYWDLFNIPTKNVSNVWDGHTPKDAYDRLLDATIKLVNPRLASVLKVANDTIDLVKKVYPKSNPIIGGSLGMVLSGYETDFHDIDIIVDYESLKDKGDENHFIDKTFEILGYNSSHHYNIRDGKNYDDDNRILKFEYYNTETKFSVNIDIIESFFDYDTKELDTFNGLFIATPESTIKAREEYIKKRKEKIGKDYFDGKWEEKIKNFYSKKSSTETRTPDFEKIKWYEI